MVSLQYANMNINLPNPDFGDSEKLEFTRISRKSRGGSLTIFRDPIWPKSDTLIMPFLLRACELEQLKSQLIYFLNQTVGKTITLIDQYNQSWQGIIINPTTVFSQPGRSRYKIQLEFQSVI